MKNDTTTTESTTSLPSSGVIKQAWKIRKEAAAAYGCHIKFVSWKSCLDKAQGSRERLKDCFGLTLGSKKSEINQYLLSAECSIILDLDGISKKFECPWVMTYVSQLVKRGVARFNHGFYNIKAEARPYWED